MKTAPHPLQTVGSLVIDYFRWSQLTPMITVWFFSVMAVLLLLFVNHEEQAWDGLESVAIWVSELPVVGPAYLEWMEEQEAADGKIKLGGDYFKRMGMKAWAVLSLAFMVISWAVGALFGPFQPWTLKRKLLLAGLGCVALMAAYVGIYALSPEMFNGSGSRWILTFAGMSFIVLMVSGWCLTIAHALGLLGRWVYETRFSTTPAEDGLV